MLEKMNGDAGQVGQGGFGTALCPPEVVPEGFTGLPGYVDVKHDNFGCFQNQEGEVIFSLPGRLEVKTGKREWFFLRG